MVGSSEKLEEQKWGNYNMIPVDRLRGAVSKAYFSLQMMADGLRDMDHMARGGNLGGQNITLKQYMEGLRTLFISVTLVNPRV